MKNWDVIRFENAPLEIIDGDRGANYPKQADFMSAGHCLFLNAGNVTENGFNFSDCSFISDLKDRELRKGKLKRLDLVLTTRGTVGNVAFYDSSVPFDHIRINSGMVIFRSATDKIVPRYLYFFLRSQFFIEQVKALSTGSAQPQLPIRDIKRIEIPIPPIPEQMAIADILGALDDKIELNRRMNETLEQLARALFKSWFVDFDPVRAKAEGRAPAGMDAETAALFPSAFDGEVPEGWVISSLGELFPDDKECVITGPFGSTLHAHDYRSEGVPLLLVKHVSYGQIVEDKIPLVGDHKLHELKRYRLKIGDIVFTRVGAVGRSAYIHPRYEDWLISGQMLRVRVKKKKNLNARFLSQVFLEPSFIGMVENFALGTTRPSLNTELLQNFKFLVPPISVQDQYAKIVESFDEKIQSNILQNQTLAELRNTLLPRLMSGEIRVKDVEKEI